MSAAGPCNREFPDEVAIDPLAGLSYTGATSSDILADAGLHGARWRMVALDAKGTALATTEWCSPPPVIVSRPVSAVAGSHLSFCGCGGES